MSVPTFHNLSFYSDPLANVQRYKDLIKSFESIYHDTPDFISRSPGRVNLIGDHIDYSYFSALPMAIETDVIGAVKVLPGSNEVVLHNTDPAFARELFVLPAEGQVVEIDKLKFSWASYFKCGYIVAQKYIQEKGNHQQPFNGLLILFDGTVPTGGGLSSSAAFCVATTMAVLRANGVTQISKEDLTRITVVSEHYVGVNNGGMDQCASIYGERDKALLIQFQPKLEGQAFAFPVVKPNDMVFLITNSLVQANKKETAPVNYNLRAVEVAVAAEVLAKQFNLKLLQDSNLGTGQLRGFMETYYLQEKGVPLWNNDIDQGIIQLNGVLALLEKIFDSEEKKSGHFYTTENTAKVLGLSTEEFQEKFLSQFPVRYQYLKLYQRSKHVYSESLRVLETLKLLREQTDGARFLSEFGRLMNESQESLSLQFETSREELATLCQVALSHGSYGSRITGAGFGGSVVHLLTTDKVETVQRELREKYYKKQFPNITEEEIQAAMTVSKSGLGTCVLEKTDGSWDF